MDTPKLASPVALTNEQLKARIAELESQLTARGNSRLSCKIGEKGGVSVYGLGRFPVSLYGAQWDRLLAFGPDIQAFMDANRKLLATKPVAAPAKA
jgi:hypothetical protein